ncbi:uncharacterized protein LOC107874643 [Capsicum annuum]|uniref:uncharacterized protein LOC107874643 n=1 Tax=Capsicum annuum TaxID=4072 RepID=UPI0007BF3BD1|nr:uncharacterized protein LOC107874643 [Capsicum annuum]
MIEKTLSTFHSSSMVLQQQYREMGFKKYSELIGHLLVAEQYKDLLIKNNETRSPGTAPFLDVNAANFHPTWHERNPNPSRGRGRGRGRGCGCGMYFNQDNRLAITNNPRHQQCKKKGKAPEATPRTNPERRCYQCGGKGHWECAYRTSKHLVKLYQASLKMPENDAETNFLLEDNIEPMDLDVSDFLANPEEQINHPVGENNHIIRLC